MIKEIEELLNDQILIKAAELFGTTRAQLKDLGGFESHVYEFERNGQAYILKITHTIRRTVNYLLGELEFVNHLAEKEVSVSKAIMSINNRLVEEIPAAQGSFLAYLFEKAPGSLIKKDEWDADKLFKWGQLSATINLHAQSFQPSDIGYQRSHWRKETKEYFDSFVPESEIEVRKKGYALMAKIDTLPKTMDSFGLAHTDLHQGNFFHHEGKLTAFDFDDCSYHYFAHDIAIALYYSQGRVKPEMSKAEYIEFFKEHFIKGYKSILPISDEWLKTIPDFLRLRHLLYYAVIYQFHGTENLSEKILAYRENHKKKILDDSWADLGFD